MGGWGDLRVVEDEMFVAGVEENEVKSKRRQEVDEEG